jgi:Leucine-rich repeat (LRR) protein
MKLKGKEKFFWERNFNIKNLASIPSAIKGITGIDSEHDDAFFFFLTSRVTTVGEIHLRCTNVTDEGVKYIANLKKLKELTLKDHRNITKACLPDLNKLVDLEYLDISKNDISTEDLYVLTNLKKLKQLFISTDKKDADLAAELEKLKNHFPGCEITVY